MTIYTQITLSNENGNGNSKSHQAFGVTNGFLTYNSTHFFNCNVQFP